MIRPQYHFRNSPDGLRAWDVRRLVELARDLPVIDVPLSDITELDEDYWFDNNLDQPTARRIAGHAKQIYDADLSYPILLCADGRIMDGMHRVCRAVLSGHQTIRAKRFTVTPPHDYLGKGPDELPYD